MSILGLFLFICGCGIIWGPGGVILALGLSLYIETVATHFDNKMDDQK